VIVNTDGMILYVNSAYERIAGYFQKNIKGAKYSSELFRLEPSAFNEMVRSNQIDNTWTGKSAFVARDGKNIKLEVNAYPLKNIQDNIIGQVIIIKDITKEAKMELHLQQTQKMEAIGTLAGGIAHDFNNILAGILGYIELALSNKDNTEKHLHMLRSSWPLTTGR